MDGIGPEYGQARADDLPTAQEAAEKVRPGSDRRLLLEAHARFPSGLTDEEAYEAADTRPGIEYATRCSELVRYGLLENTPLQREGNAGMRRVVRIITTRGYLALEMLPPERKRPAAAAAAAAPRPTSTQKDAPLIPFPEPKFGRPFCPKCNGYGGTVETRCPRCGGTGYRS